MKLQKQKLFCFFICLMFCLVTPVKEYYSMLIILQPIGLTVVVNINFALNLSVNLDKSFKLRDLHTRILHI